MMNMFPNIKQRINANRNKGKNRKYRKKISEIFNISLYHYRGLIVEGIFGAEETAHHHQLYCKFRLKNNQKRFGLIMGIYRMESVCPKQIAMRKKTRNKDYTVCYIELGNNPALIHSINSVTIMHIILGIEGFKSYM